MGSPQNSVATCGRLHERLHFAHRIVLSWAGTRLFCCREAGTPRIGILGLALVLQSQRWSSVSFPRGAARAAL
eukprot:2180386-Alexandrium_andersonii.AAC.1